MQIKQKKLAGKSALPILVHDKKIINESSEIVSYLDQAFPNKLLTPGEKKLQKEAIEWENFADKNLGPDVRSLCYYTLLNHPDIICRYFTDGGPWYGNLYMKFTYPKLSQRMRELMQLNDETIKQSKQRLSKAIEKVYLHIKDREYFVGESFTRADLAIASLLAPLCRPNKYGVVWPSQFPEPLHNDLNEYAGKLDWVTRIYKEHR